MRICLMDDGWVGGLVSSFLELMDVCIMPSM